MELHQKNGLFNQKTFKVSGNTLHIIDKTTEGIKSWTINIDNIGNQVYTEVKSKKAGIITSIFFLSFTVFFIAVYLADGKNTLELWAWLTIAGFFTFIGIVPFFIPPKNTISILGGSEIVTLYFDSPNHEKVMEFVQYLIQKSKEILKLKYGIVDTSLPEEVAINQFNWLKNQNVISIEEYEMLKEEYYTKRMLR